MWQIDRLDAVLWLLGIVLVLMAVVGPTLVWLTAAFVRERAENRAFRERVHAKLFPEDVPTAPLRLALELTAATPSPSDPSRSTLREVFTAERGSTPTPTPPGSLPPRGTVLPGRRRG